MLILFFIINHRSLCVDPFRVPCLFIPVLPHSRHRCSGKQKEPASLLFWIRFIGPTPRRAIFSVSRWRCSLMNPEGGPERGSGTCGMKKSTALNNRNCLTVLAVRTPKARCSRGAGIPQSQQKEILHWLFQPLPVCKRSLTLPSLLPQWWMDAPLLFPLYMSLFTWLMRSLAVLGLESTLIQNDFALTSTVTLLPSKAMF